MLAPRVAVAASGGRDSTALLHCTVRQARALGLGVVALHVHHGLQPEADAWLNRVRVQARRWGADFACRRLSGSPPTGDSVEAWARRGRLAALADMARDHGCSLLLLAQHRRDQAETVLLQALRSAGPAGLSAMPAQQLRQGLVWARPWLDQPREAIEHYLKRHRLRPVDDASNADARYSRSRLRTQVWPAFVQAFPELEEALCAVARQAQQAARLAEEIADLDLPTVLSPDGSLQLAVWRALPPARRRNALQHWLRQGLAAPVPDSLLQRLSRELPGRAGARWPAGLQTLQRQGDTLCIIPTPAPRPPAARPALQLDLSRPGRYPVADWAGCWVVTPAVDGGLAPHRLALVSMTPRTGGEHFRLHPTGVDRSLKKQYQARGVGPDARHGPVLRAADGCVLFVHGLGLNAACRSEQVEPGGGPLALAWVPDTRSSGG